MSFLKKTGLILGVLSVLCGCSSGKETEKRPIYDISEGRELCCVCQSEEEAREIAEAYGIELVAYGNGIAAFHTEDDPRDVIQYGKDHNLPPLELNRKIRKQN